MTINMLELKERQRANREDIFHGQRYWYNTPHDGRRMIGVCQGLGGDIWIVASVRESGARKKINTVKLPALTNPDLLQGLLDVWAKAHELEEVA